MPDSAIAVAKQCSRSVAAGPFVVQAVEDAHVVLVTFSTIPYRPTMPDTPNLRPATRDELTQSLSFALRFNGRKRVHDADETMARITAKRLVEHLERSGYVVMTKPGLGQHGTAGNLAGWIEKATETGRGE